MRTFSDTQYQDAHDDFIRWKESNPKGFVINYRSASNAMLHRAHCGHFIFSSDDAVSLTDKPKVCSTDRRELETWARENTKELKKCRSCM